MNTVIHKHVFNNTDDMRIISIVRITRTSP